jgi:hypothetical protein
LVVRRSKRKLAEDVQEEVGTEEEEVDNGSKRVKILGSIRVTSLERADEEASPVLPLPSRGGRGFLAKRKLG